MGEQKYSFGEFQSKATGAKCTRTEDGKVVCTATIDGKPVDCVVNPNGGDSAVVCKVKEPNTAV